MFYNQPYFEKWINHSIETSSSSSTFIQVDTQKNYNQYRVHRLQNCDPNSYSLAKGLKKTIIEGSVRLIQVEVTTCFTHNVFVIGALDIVVMAATKHFRLISLN